MKAMTASLVAGLYLVLLVLGAVAEPVLPKITFLNNQVEVSSRAMTAREHTLYLKLKLALERAESFDADGLTKTSMQLANASVKRAVAEISRDADVMVDADFAVLAEAIAEEASEIARAGELIANAGDAFKAEVRKNTPDIEFDEVEVNGSDTFSFHDSTERVIKTKKVVRM
jgi:hypothetical protein